MLTSTGIRNLDYALGFRVMFRLLVLVLLQGTVTGIY